MRLYYIEGKAIKAQLLQIEQRLSLCEFIHDYVETKNNSGAEKESWSLFEKLIFSPIQVSSENIPSLLDGASSIAELAGKYCLKIQNNHCWLLRRQAASNILHELNTLIPRTLLCSSNCLE